MAFQTGPEGAKGGVVLESLDHPSKLARRTTASSQPAKQRILLGLTLFWLRAELRRRPAAQHHHLQGAKQGQRGTRTAFFLVRCAMAPTLYTVWRGGNWDGPGPLLGTVVKWSGTYFVAAGLSQHLSVFVFAQAPVVAMHQVLRLISERGHGCFCKRLPFLRPCPLRPLCPPRPPYWSRPTPLTLKGGAMLCVSLGL